MKRFRVCSDIVKEGKYVEFRALKKWTCGDGCCSDMDDAEVGLIVGTEVYIDDWQFGNDTYEIGSDYEGYSNEYYRPIRGWEELYMSPGYATDGAYLKPID